MSVHQFKTVRYLTDKAGIKEGELKPLPMHLALAMIKKGFAEDAGKETLEISDDELNAAAKKHKDAELQKKKDAEAVDARKQDKLRHKTKEEKSKRNTKSR